MGGLNSGRWGLHVKKTTVESCKKLTIRDVGNLADDTRAIQVSYTITPRGGDPSKVDYSIPLTFTLTPWGARRWLFICPLAVNGRPCGQRAAALYLPPGQRFFGCRRCHNLTYKSSQESHRLDSLYRFMAKLTGGGLDHGREIHEAFEYSLTGEMTPWLYSRLASRLESQAAAQRAELESRLAELANYDPYGHYLTPAELCEQSGLTLDSLAALESARLLLPDHGGKYRPKLAGWGRKLSYLLGEGWTLPELAAWARGRWATPNPRTWPPERAAWQG